MQIHLFGHQSLQAFMQIHLSGHKYLQEIIAIVHNSTIPPLHASTPQEGNKDKMHLPVPFVRDSITYPACAGVHLLVPFVRNSLTCPACTGFNYLSRLCGCSLTCPVHTGFTYLSRSYGIPYLVNIIFLVPTSCPSQINVYKYCPLANAPPSIATKPLPASFTSLVINSFPVKS
jgi:hypothetical protein